MKLHHFISKIIILFFIVFIAVFLVPSIVMGHCDTMDGPVVADANKAFETKNANYVLKWVKAENEAEVKQAFDLVMKVRPLNSDAKLLAEKYFYDVLVRIHRATEGEPFTGVKPLGTPIDEKVKEADKSLETGNITPLEKLISKDRLSELKERFEKANALKNFDVNNVQAGREYIEAYVQFLKFA
jgi:hypothetical protein